MLFIFLLFFGTLFASCSSVFFYQITTPGFAIYTSKDVQGCCRACESVPTCCTFMYDTVSNNCSLYTADVPLTFHPVASGQYLSSFSTVDYTFPTIYVGCICLLVTLVLWLGFILFFIRNTKGKRAKVHCTISAYCSDKQLYNTTPKNADYSLINEYESNIETVQIDDDYIHTLPHILKLEFNRIFLIIATMTIGWSLAAILCEEYNSRPELNPPILWIQLSICILFPLVGIFPVKHDMDLLFVVIPGPYCKVIHLTCAILFFVGLAICNLVNSVYLILDESKYGLGFIIGDGIVIGVILIFVGFILSKKCGCSKSTSASRKHWIAWWTATFESAAFWAVTIMTAVASVRRNRFVDFGAEDYYKIA